MMMALRPSRIVNSNGNRRMTLTYLHCPVLTETRNILLIAAVTRAFYTVAESKCLDHLEDAVFDGNASNIGIDKFKTNEEGL